MKCYLTHIFSSKIDINIIHKNYAGEFRNVNADLGGYVILIDNEDEVKAIRSGILKDIIPEFIYEIKSYESTKY
ncbi:hypothetical protein GT646_17985 [Clostridium butyricum]|nr:hypothetical protein [Clostridium butyricum]